MRKQLLALSLFLFALSAPAWAEEYDLPTRDWSTTDARPLNKYPPSDFDVVKFVNRLLDTDWNIPVCSFAFIDVYDGNFRLVASLDANGRHSCSRVVMIGKNSTYFHVYNDWKVIDADNVNDILRDLDNNHSPEIILTQAWSKPEGKHCTATTQRIYQWNRGRFTDQSEAHPEFYKERLKYLQDVVKTASDPTCIQMEMDKIDRLLGSPKAEMALAKDWMKNTDPAMRRKAAALFADMGDESSKKNLAQLAKDADPLTAESAKLYLESPRTYKE